MKKKIKRKKEEKRGGEIKRERQQKKMEKQRFFITIYYITLKSESEVAQSCPTLWTLWTVTHHSPPSMGFSQQEYWSGLPCSSPGDLPNTGIEPRSHTLQADFTL